MASGPIDQIEIQRLIGEVAKRHNLLLRRDDPAFVILTLNELYLTRLVDQLQAAVEAAQDEASAGAMRQQEAAKALAGRVITGGADYVARETRAAVAELQAAIKLAAAAELAAVRRAAAEAQEARRGAWRAVIAAAGIAGLFIGAAAASWVLAPDGRRSGPRHDQPPRGGARLGALDRHVLPLPLPQAACAWRTRVVKYL